MSAGACDKNESFWVCRTHAAILQEASEVSKIQPVSCPKEKARASGPRPRTDSDALLLSAHLLKEQADGFDPAVEVRDVKLFIGSVQIVVGKPEAHHHAGNL